MSTQTDLLAASRGETSFRARRDAPLGGQAVMEGVMMRGVASWAVAVREPTPEQLAASGPDGPAPGEAALGAIRVVRHPFDSVLKRHRALRLPLLRGVVALVESMRVGIRALRISADLHAGRSEQEIPRAVWAGTVLAGLAMSIGLFFLIPVGLTSLIKNQLDSATLFWLIEGAVRTLIFLAYLVLITRVRDLRRVFEYHGAEHKTISCHEAGLALTPEHAQRFSRLHPRCGTSFLLIVMVVSIFVFAPLGLPAWYWLLATRVLGVPVIAGLSFELIKALGRHRTRAWARALTWPGMQLQKLTTAEPDHDQLAVAIAALQAVLEHEPAVYAAEDLVGAEVTA